jgi:hypothetical protein
MGPQVRDGDVEIGEGEAAIHLERLAGQEGTGRRRQIHCGGSDIDGIAEAAQGCHLLHRLAQFVVGGHHVQRGGEDRAGCDGVDPDARAQVQRRRPGVMRQRSFGGGVGREATSGQPAHGGGDVDDAAASGVLQHQRHRGDGQRVGGGHVEGECVLQVLGRGGQQRIGHGPADVVDDDVELSEGLDGLGGQLRGRLGMSQVGGDDVGFAAHRADLFGDGF